MFRSLSNRTTVSLTYIEESLGKINLIIQFTQDYLIIEGLTQEKARQALNARVDKAIMGYKDVVRRTGQKGTYEVLLDVKYADANLRGVNTQRMIISRVIDALESR